MAMFQPGAVLNTQAFANRPESLEVPHYDSREPTTSDILYPLGKHWLYIGDSEWVLMNFYWSGGNLLANWVELATSGGTAIEQITVDNSLVITPLGTPQNITITGNTVANALNSKPVYFTRVSTAVGTIDVQLAAVVAATPVSNVSAGLACFNNAQFDIDATSGMVSLQGSTGPALTKLGMQTGTSPVVPDASGLITLQGATVAAGTNPIRTNGTGANTAEVQVQFSQAIAATDATKVGLCNFLSTQFAVDANGFVSLSGAAVATTYTCDTGSATPAANNINVFGAGGATTSGAGSTITITAENTFAWQTIVASQTLVKFVGYFCISPGGALSLALPSVASTAIGDEIIVSLDGATSFTITQAASQQVRVGSSQTTAGVGGSIASTAQGDTIHLVAQSTTKWVAINWVGSLTVV